MTRRLITHIDDLGITEGTVVAMRELADRGAVTCGSVMVPTPRFGDVAQLATERPDLDLGVHLTLTSESDHLKWGPVSSPGPGSGLTDENGHFWKTVQQVRDRADPGAVRRELLAQVEQARAAGIRVSHLDHHMGAAINPELVDVTIALSRDLGIPLLFPRRIGEYFTLLGKGTVDVAAMEARRDELEERGELYVDTFLMGLEVDEPDTRLVYERLLSRAPAGTTFVSLHCSAPGSIEQIYPHSAQRRIEEYRLFGDPAFIEWLGAREVALTSFRALVPDR